MEDKINKEKEREEKEERDFQENLNSITSFLNKFNKDYTVEYWGSCGGVNIIVHCMGFDGELGLDGKPYDQIISLNYAGYLDFERQDFEDKNETD